MKQATRRIKTRYLTRSLMENTLFLPRLLVYVCMGALSEDTNCRPRSQITADHFAI